MPFDPNLPQAGTEIDAVQMRSQLNGLKALIDAIQSITAAQVDGVNTLPPGTPANASVSVSGNTLHFTFDLPQGQPGPQGDPGSPGNDGGPGLAGPQGPPFAQAVVDAVNTVNPGDPAAVSVNFDGTNVRFTFNIPRGHDGSQGTPGSDGAPGPPFAQALVDAVNTLPSGSPASVGVNFDGTYVRFTFDIPQGHQGLTGPQGPPGEVTQTDLNNGLLNNLSQCSNNSNSVSTLDPPYADPESEELRQKVNELINALRR